MKKVGKYFGQAKYTTHVSPRKYSSTKQSIQAFLLANASQHQNSFKSPKSTILTKAQKTNENKLIIQVCHKKSHQLPNVKRSIK